MSAILGAALPATFSMANTLKVLLSSTKSLVSLPAGEAVHHSWGLHFYVNVAAWTVFSTSKPLQASGLVHPSADH